jgi:hypothetical protein
MLPGVVIAHAGGRTARDAGHLLPRQHHGRDDGQRVSTTRYIVKIPAACIVSRFLRYVFMLEGPALPKTRCETRGVAVGKRFMNVTRTERCEDKSVSFAFTFADRMAEGGTMEVWHGDFHGRYHIPGESLVMAPGDIILGTQEMYIGKQNFTIMPA